MKGKPIKDASFKHMSGGDVGIEWLEEDPTAMTEPIVIDSPEGLGMKMPPSDFTVSDVAETVGDDHPLEVIGTSSPSSGGFV